MSLGEGTAIPGTLPALTIHMNGSGADSSGNAASPTETAMSWTSGRLGSQCGSFNGTTSYIYYPNLAAYNLTTGTFSCWIKTTYTANYQYLSAKNDNTPPNDNYLRAIGAGSSQKVCFYGGGAWRNGNTSVCDGNRHRVCLVGTTGSGIMYVDGEADGSHAFSPFLATGSGSNLHVGYRAFDTARVFNGEMDEFILASGNPTAAQVKRYYTYNKGRFGII